MAGMIEAAVGADAGYGVADAGGKVKNVQRPKFKLRLVVPVLL
jgi:hypothetical protein